MPTIKKIGNIVFTILNTVIIISLLLFSTILILSVNSNSPSILGFSSKLIFDRADDSAMLVISQTASQLEPNDEFLYISADGVGVYMADTVTETAITYRGVDNSITFHVDLASPEFGGKVLVKNAAIGEMLSTLVKTESISVVYVLIIGTFSLLLLLLFLIHYLFKNKDKLVEYYEEEVEETIGENGEIIQTTVKAPAVGTPAVQATMAETFEEIPEMIITNDKKSKKKNKKAKEQSDSEVLDLIDGIEKNPRTAPTAPLDRNAQTLQTPANTRGRRAAVSKANAMPESNLGADVSTYELEITEDTTSFLPSLNSDSGYSEDDILAVLTEPNATFVVEEEEEDYYEDGHVKYFSNGIEKPTLQESLIAYVHTNPDVDPEPPLPLAKVNDGIPIEWFESILEVANEDPRLPEVLLEDFEIKPTQIEEPVTSARDIMSRVEEMSTFKRQYPAGAFSVVNTANQTPAPKPSKPSADSLLQEIDSLFQKPNQQEDLMQVAQPEPIYSKEPTLENTLEQNYGETYTQQNENTISDYTDSGITEDEILSELKEQYG